MLNNLYFWKNKRSDITRRLSVSKILIALLIIIIACVGSWYYFVMLPAQTAREASIASQQQAAQKIQSNIDSVESFYAKSLDGASIDRTIDFLSELRLSEYPFTILNLNSVIFKCDTKTCSFGYRYDKGELLVLPEKTLWGKRYPASVPGAKGKDKDKVDFEYKKIESKLNGNTLLKNYKSKKALPLKPCDEVVSYILTYNSFVKSVTSKSKKNNSNENAVIVIKSMPKSPVINLESQLPGKVKAHGLMAGTWELSFKGNNRFDEIILNMQVLLYKQAFRDVFLIKRIESTNAGMKVSGGLVCKG